jgi:mannose-6-phosphate isomerase-like protein (cupin superfamily)
MSYKVTKANEAVPYQAPGHYDVLATRLHNPDEVNGGTIVNGLSHFQSGGGAETAPANFEMIYYIIEGEMTVTLFDDADKEAQYALHAGDSVHFGKGTKRSCKNTGSSTAKMLTVMIKPQA